MKDVLVKKCLAVGIILLFIGASIIPSTAQNREKPSLPISKVWMKTFGGTGNDSGGSVQQTTDGGYIITGTTESFGDSSGDVWLIKTDDSGNKMWDKTFRGTGYDAVGISVQQTTDGGYIITGTTSFIDSDVCDVWLIKTDSSGNKMWDKIFGGKSDDVGFSVQQTTDGGYIITGFTGSFGAGGDDVWLIKTDSNGNKMWDKTFGGTHDDEGLSVQQTNDDGYIITGSTESFGSGDYWDMWLIKTDSNGNKVWDKIFGGTSDDVGFSVQQTTDAGYIITGYTYSNGASDCDVWLIKTDNSGNKMWDKTFGGTHDDWGLSVQQTTDGGYIIAGLSFHFFPDVLLIKTDSSGNKMWDKTFGGTGSDWGRSVQQTTDGGYIITGSTDSFGVGYDDVLLIKTDENGVVTNSPNTPTITGKTNGKTGIMYNYIINTTDPDQDKVKYYIDWGDNTITVTGLNESGKKIIVSHIWNTKGTYNVKVKAIDENYAESNWTTLPVTMPCSYNVPLFQVWERLLERFPICVPDTQTAARILENHTSFSSLFSFLSFDLHKKHEPITVLIASGF